MTGILVIGGLCVILADGLLDHWILGAQDEILLINLNLHTPHLCYFFISMIVISDEMKLLLLLNIKQQYRIDWILLNFSLVFRSMRAVRNVNSLCRIHDAYMQKAAFS